MIVRRAAVGCLVGALAVPVAAAGSSPRAAGGGPPLTTVTVAALPVEPTAQAFYALHRGFFRRQGIDARITIVSDPSQIPAAVVSGTVRFSSFNIGGLAILKSRGAPVRLVASGALYRRRAPTTALLAARGRTIIRPRDLVGKTVAIDAPNTLAHVGLRRWLRRNGVDENRVRLVYFAFAQMPGLLRRGAVDAAVVPEPYLTVATQRGARRIAHLFDAVCPRTCLLTAWIARRDVDPGLAARFRNAIQAAAVWANRERNQRASGAILRRYADIDASVVRRMRRTRFATRLVPSQAQPWIDAFAEFGAIPASFRAIDLTR